MGFLEIYAFLQQQLAGVWEVQSNGISTKKVLESDKWTDAGQAVWIDLSTIPPLDAALIRLHCQNVVENSAHVSMSQPIATFELEKYPQKGNLDKFEIGAVRFNGKVILTHVFR